MNTTSNSTSNKTYKTEILGKERKRRWSPSEKQSIVSETERMLGRKTEQVEILRDAIELAREKKLISRQPLPGVEDIPFATSVKPLK